MGEVSVDLASRVFSSARVTDNGEKIKIVGSSSTLHGASRVEYCEFRHGCSDGFARPCCYCYILMSCAIAGGLHDQRSPVSIHGMVQFINNTAEPEGQWNGRGGK